MKKLILILLLLMTAQAWGYKAVMITYGDTTVGVRNVNVDSIRYDIINDPQKQLPGTWTVDLLARTSVHAMTDSAWKTYDVIIPWGGEEGNSDVADTFLSVLDTMKRPIITRNAYTAAGAPMRLGTGKNVPSGRWFRLKDTDHFISRNTYTRNAYTGDSIRIYSQYGTYQIHRLTGIATGAVTICDVEGDLNGADGDSATLVVLDSGATNTASAAAPHRRGYVGLTHSWRYASWAARDLFFRTLRWAVADTTIDTCVTTVMIAREGIDANWMEYSGGVCQTTWHYGGYSSGLLTGWDIYDRASVFRARTSAINTQLPDTSATWAYDIVETKLNCYIQGIAESVPATVFSCWEGLFEILYDNVALWVDANVSYQLDSTCASWLSADPDTLMNSQYFVFPDHAWNTARGSTRGTDYSTTAFDSVWIQDPIVTNWMVWGNLGSYIIEARDSLSNQGLITHTIGSITGDGEITLTTEIGDAYNASVRQSPRFDIYLQWRPANEAAGDLDSSIAFNPDSVIFSGYENGTNPTARTLAYFNGSSGEYFGCDAVVERPTASWLTQVTQGDGYITNSVDLDGLTAGYYSTYMVLTCTGVSDSPDSAKVILHVNPVPTRETGGKLKF